MDGYDFPTDYITIKWNNGRMHIVLDKFFPTVVQKTKLVFKHINEDPEWTRERIGGLLEYFTGKCGEYTENAKTLNERYWEAREEMEAKRPATTKRTSPEYIAWTLIRDEVNSLDKRKREALRLAEGYQRAAKLLIEQTRGSDEQ